MAMCSNSPKEEIRWTSAYLLNDKVRPKNLHVLSDCVVDKILFQNNYNKTVEYESFSAKSVLLQDINGSNFEVYLNDSDDDCDGGDVVLCNGAFGATSVLQRSGVGPISTLKKVSYITLYIIIYLFIY